MTNVSRELMLVENIANASKWHKERCHDSECNVSLYQLKQAAEFIERFMRMVGRSESELTRADELISEMTSI